MVFEMRLVMIENCDYEKFESIRDKLMSTIPFALVGVCYSPKLKTAVFNFWDSDYIPEDLKEFIYKPSPKMIKQK